ncbi:MAG: radical SAM protein [Anaerolineaceae bacterium]|nr:radical SAM protein [Anaerolineaceae bacterium]MBN2677208.1 radical SAM protein [Anaerolineaceae bacterium]
MTKLTEFFRIFTSTEKQKALPAGIYHYQSPPEVEQPFRLHLRLEEDGTGILIVNASTLLHLNQTAAEYVYHLVHASSEESVVNRVSARYSQVNKNQIRKDFTDIRNRILTVINTPDLEPEIYLDFERLDPHSRTLSAPLRLDCALTYKTNGSRKDTTPVKRVKRELTSAEWMKILDKACEAGIPHILFTGGEPTLRPDLPELVEYAEKKEMVCGLLTDGLRLSETKYLHTLLQAGLDHIMLILAPDTEQSWEALKDTLAEDIHITVHVTLTPALVKKIASIFDRLMTMGITHVSLSASDPKLVAQLKEARDLLAMKGLTLVWDMPVPYSDLHPVALETEDESIPGAGKAWIYLEPDGDVMPGQGIKKVFGNLLDQSWEDVWKNRPS